MSKKRKIDDYFNKRKGDCDDSSASIQASPSFIQTTLSSTQGSPMSIQAPSPESHETSIPKSCTQSTQSSTQGPPVSNQAPSPKSHETCPTSKVKEFPLEKLKTIIEEEFKGTKNIIHNYSICKDKCDSLSSADPQKTSKNKHRFKHSILMDQKTSFSKDTGLWWLVYVECEGMYCIVCRKHFNLNPNNKDTFCKTPAIRYRTEAILDHAKSKVHSSAELEENVQRISPFQKEIDNRKEYASEVLMIAFSSLYWLAKEEVANSKFKALMKLLESVGVDQIKHFNYSSAGSVREMFLNIGDVISENLVKEISMADSFGLMIDEVTDIALVEQLVCFIQYVDSSGCPVIKFLFTADLLKESDSADAITIVKVIKQNLEKLGIDINKMHSLTTDGASVMTGKRNGVAALLRKEHPGIINVHCICHNLALACADTKADLKDIDLVQLTLQQLWKFFQYSPKRTAVYLKVQENTKELKLNESSKRVVAKKLKKACTTRWLSFDLSVKATFDDYPAVLQTLSHLSEKESAAFGLLKRMKKTRFLGTVYILKCILPVLAKLSKIFQGGSIDFSQIEPSIRYTVDTIEDICTSKQPLEDMKKDLKEGKLTMLVHEFKDKEVEPQHPQSTREPGDLCTDEKSEDTVLSIEEFPEANEGKNNVTSKDHEGMEVSTKVEEVNENVEERSDKIEDQHEEKESSYDYENVAVISIDEDMSIQDNSQHNMGTENDENNISKSEDSEIKKKYSALRNSERKMDVDKVENENKMMESENVEVESSQDILPDTRKVENENMELKPSKDNIHDTRKVEICSTRDTSKVSRSVVVDYVTAVKPKATRTVTEIKPKSARTVTEFKPKTARTVTEISKTSPEKLSVQERLGKKVSPDTTATGHSKSVVKSPEKLSAQERLGKKVSPKSSPDSTGSGHSRTVTVVPSTKIIKLSSSKTVPETETKSKSMNEESKLSKSPSDATIPQSKSSKAVSETAKLPSKSSKQISDSKQRPSTSKPLSSKKDATVKSSKHKSKPPAEDISKSLQSSSKSSSRTSESSSKVSSKSSSSSKTSVSKTAVKDSMEKDKETLAPALTKNQMELLELEMRARAIKAMLAAHEKKEKESEAKSKKK